MARLIDAKELERQIKEVFGKSNPVLMGQMLRWVRKQPTIEPERPKGRWVLTAHEESCNYRWNVTAECSECGHSKGEVYAGFFPGFPKDLARDTILRCAESVKLDNFCPNCGADMRESESDGDL